jgi:hypothetical protein
MPSRLSFLIASLLLLALAGPAQSQSTQSLAAAVPIRFESWRPAAALDLDTKPVTGQFVAPARNRTRRALLGGAVGAVSGVVFCTAVSTLVDDSAEGGVSFCPLDSYLLIGGAGFALGFAIGWVI